MLKKCFAIFCVCALCFTMFSVGYAASEDGYVFDSMGVLEADEVATLNQMADQLSQTYGCCVCIHLTDQAHDTDMDTYKKSFYDEHIGAESGLLFLIDYNEKLWGEYRVGLAEHIFTDADTDALWEAYSTPETWYDGVQGFYLKAEALMQAFFAAAADGVQAPETEAVAEAAPTYFRLVDRADLLTDAQEEKLAARLDEISARQNCDIVVVTVNGLDGKTPMAYADDYYDYNGYRPDGILLLVSMADRDWYISTTGFGITAVTDAGLNYLSDQFLEDLSDGNYATAFRIYAEQCDAFLTQAKTGKPYDVGNMPKTPLPVYWILIALAIGLVIALMGTGRLKGQLNSVALQASASNYVRAGSMHITDAREVFLYNHVTRTLRESSSSGGGGSSTHTSSSGSSHGGGGGKF